MNLSQLDGFGRVENTEMNGRRSRRSNKRKRMTKSATPKRVATSSAKGAQMVKAYKKEIDKGSDYKRSAEIPATKRQKQAQKIAKYSSRGMNGENDGSRSDIGFARIYEDNQPGVNLNGFNRVKYSNEMLQGLSLQGQTILQGYAMGDSDDLDEWNYLLSIEHPDTLQGFPSWVLNGKKERQARRAKRKAKKATKTTARTAKKAKREERRGAGQERRQRQKEVRTAKKEERLQKQVQRRELRAKRQEERQARKAQRITDRATRQKERQETRRLRQEAKAGRGGLLKDLVRGGGDDGLIDVARDLIGSRGDFEDFTYQDFTEDQLPFGFEDQIDFLRDQPSEDILDMRDRDLELMDDTIDDFTLDEPDEKKGSMLLPIILLAGGAMMMNKDKQKKKK